MASRAWSEQELEALSQNRDRRDWFIAVSGKFVDRSPAALRSMMQKIRADAGMSDQRCVDSAWMADAINGTRRLLVAIEQAGVYPV
jgi:hypothetical protein